MGLVDMTDTEVKSEIFKAIPALEEWMKRVDAHAREEERLNLLLWLMRKQYLCEVFYDEDEDFDGNRTYETVVQYLDASEIIEEYLKEMEESDD